jgi:hypothetical protein
MAGRKTEPIKPLLINQIDAATMIGVPTGKLLRWVKTRVGGFPPPVRVVERTYLFSRVEVERWARIQAGSGESQSPG